MFCISSVAPSIRVLKSRIKSTRFCCNPMLFYGERDTIESYCVTRSESMRRKVISVRQTRDRQVPSSKTMLCMPEVTTVSFISLAAIQCFRC